MPDHVFCFPFSGSSPMFSLLLPPGTHTGTCASIHLTSHSSICSSIYSTCLASLYSSLPFSFLSSPPCLHFYSSFLEKSLKHCPLKGSSSFMLSQPLDRYLKSVDFIVSPSCSKAFSGSLLFIGLRSSTTGPHLHLPNSWLGHHSLPGFS